MAQFFTLISTRLVLIFKYAWVTENINYSSSYLQELLALTLC